MVPVTLWLVQQVLIKRAGETVALGAADIADKLDLVLAERSGDITAFAQSPLLLDRDRRHLQPYLEELHRIYPIYRRIAIVDEQGRLIASGDAASPAGPPVSSSMLAATLTGSGPQIDVMEEPLQSGGRLRGVRFSAALRGPGNRGGAMITEIDQDTLRAFVTQTARHAHGSSLNLAIDEFTVLNGTGDVLLTSRGDGTPQDDTDWAPVAGRTRSDSQGSGYVEEIDRHSGRHALVGYARMAGLPGSGAFQWQVRIRVDRAEVLGSIWMVLWKLMGIGSIGLGPLLGLFYWASRRQAAEEARALTARRALEANDARIRTIVDIALDSVIIFDAAGHVREWNPQAAATFGFSLEEAVGRPLTELIIPPAHRDAHREGLERYADTGAPTILNRRIEVIAMHQDGHELPVELSVIPLHVDEQLSFCAFVRDITERRSADATLRRSQSAAEAANKAKSEFLANVSHELRTPLNALLGTLDLLAESAATPEQHEYAAMGKRAGSVLLHLVNDLLDMAKVEAGTLRIESTPFDPAELLRRTHAMMAPRARRRACDSRSTSRTTCRPPSKATRPDSSRCSSI